jgi:hypothetical protein
LPGAEGPHEVLRSQEIDERHQPSVSFTTSPVLKPRVSLEVVRVGQLNTTAWTAKTYGERTRCGGGPLADYSEELQCRRRRKLNVLVPVEPQGPATGTEIDFDGRGEAPFETEGCHFAATARTGHAAPTGDGHKRIADAERIRTAIVQ